MTSKEAELKQLFNLYYAGETTLEQTREFYRLVQNAENQEFLSCLIKDRWNSEATEHAVFNESETDQILSSILNKINPAEKIEDEPPAASYPFIKYSVAASIILILSFAVYFIPNTNTPPLQQAVKKQNLNDALPGGNKAKLTLADGSEIVLDDAKNGTISAKPDAKVNKVKDGELVYESKNTQSTKANSLNIISTPRGGKYTIVLTDGSRVFLNAATTLKFPSAFAGNERKVELSGEAYFEVAKDKAKPFKVILKNQVIEVLGTHFNVKAYEEETAVKTTLVEGSVKVSSGNQGGILKPGQQAVLENTGEFSVLNHVNTVKEIAWKNGFFIFRNAGIESIMREIGRWYDVDVVFKGKIPVRQFNGKISRNVKASEVLNMFKYTGQNFSIDGKTVTIIN